MRPVDLGPDAAAIAATAAGIAGRATDAWSALADAGALGLATPEGGGGAAELVAVYEALGGRVPSGPLVATVLAAQLLDGDSRAAIVGGEARAGIHVGDVVVAGMAATHIVEIDGVEAFVVQPTGPLEPMVTMAGEPWARVPAGVTMRCTRVLGGAGETTTAYACADLAAAAWVIGAARLALDQAVEHVKAREQFGRTLASFQAVAHKLSRARADVDAARNQLVLAALAHDRVGPSRSRAAAARRTASATALRAGYAAHQCCGGLGFTVEAGLGPVTAGIRQCASLPPFGDEPRAAVVDDETLELARF